MMAVILDITELVQNPIRTGIQRVVRELIRHWPDPEDLRLARFDPLTGLHPIPPSVTSLLVNGDGVLADAKPDQIASLIKERLDNAVIPLPEGALIFVPEVFFDHARCAWYRHILANDRNAVAFLLYDFIPWLFPHRFGFSGTAALMPYLQVVRTAVKVAFISGQTKLHYFDRIKHAPAGAEPVLPLGADGLSLPRQTFDPAKKTWVSIGSIDGRKNQARIVQAFCQLWNDGFDGELVLIGRVFDNMDEEWRRIKVHDRRFRHIQDATDEEIENELRRARATIYLSDIEGFGLPPMESLQVGIPVIVTQGVPSVQDIYSNGQIRLKCPSVKNITCSVKYLSDDNIAADLWKQASKLYLPKWREFSKMTSDWLRTCAA